jgi:hypothetical protein
MKIRKLIIAAIACGALSGCASITGSKLQPVSVNTIYKGDDVDGAKCSLMNDKGSWYVTTPGSVTLQKSYGDMTVTCKKKGMGTGVASLTSHNTGPVWGNVIAGGIIGYAVDASSGAGFDYPTDITVEMGKTVTIAPPKKTAQAPQTPNGNN